MTLPNGLHLSLFLLCSFPKAREGGEAAMNWVTLKGRMMERRKVGIKERWNHGTAENNPKS